MTMKRVYVQGKTLNKRTYDMLKLAEDRLGYGLTILQGSYHGGVGASAGTHDGGGVVDLLPYDWQRKVRVLREVGFAAWHRPYIAGLWPEHIHAVAIGDPELAPAARNQVTAYYNGRNGLADNGYDDGPRLNPIPVWPVRKRLKPIATVVAVRQFKAKHPKSRHTVKAIQECLNKRLGTDLLVDGVAGPITRNAYKSWEKKVDAPVPDGVPGPMSLRKLVRGYYRVI